MFYVLSKMTQENWLDQWSEGQTITDGCELCPGAHMQPKERQKEASGEHTL